MGTVKQENVPIDVVVRENGEIVLRIGEAGRGGSAELIMHAEGATDLASSLLWAAKAAKI